MEISGNLRPSRRGPQLWKCSQDYRGDAKGCDLALTLAVAFGEEIVRARTCNLRHWMHYVLSSWSI